MKLRPFQDSDINRIDAIWQEYHSRDFSVPNRKTSVVDAVVEDDDGIVVAYGQVKLFAEAMFILDHGASQRAKVAALKLLILEALRGANVAGLDDIYCFIKDPHFASLISKHFGFDLVEEPGDLLLRKV